MLAAVDSRFRGNDGQDGSEAVSLAPKFYSAELIIPIPNHSVG
ncbi:hypothetical protein BH18ACT11_BH18ACT11_26450 [soil metagenome]